jgi:hypothetical protein
MNEHKGDLMPENTERKAGALSEGEADNFTANIDYTYDT